MMGGIVGRLFREFAVTLSTSIVVSMVISLTTTPMMCAYLLKNVPREGHGRLYRATERFFDRLLAGYRSSLRWVLGRPGLTLFVLFLTIALNFVVVLKIPKGFFPTEDTGSLAGAVQGPQDTSFIAMNDGIQRIIDVIDHDPAVENVIGFTGASGGPSNAATNTGSIFVALKPLEERKIGATKIIDRLRPQLNRLPVASAFLQAVQDLRIGGRSSNAQYQYTLQSDSGGALAKWGPTILREMRGLPGLQDVSSDQQNGGLDVQLTYDRVTAAKLGQTAQALDTELYDAFGQAEVSIIYTQANQYYVVLEAAPQFLLDPEGLKYIYMQSSPPPTAARAAGAAPTASAAAASGTVPGGGAVPLLAMATSRAGTTPLALNHTSLFPSVTVSFNLATGVSLSDATKGVDAMRARLGVPADLRSFYSGTLLAYQQSLGTEPVLVLLALLAVYIVLGVLYESLVHPLTIISTLPSASVGAMLALIVFHADLNIVSIIGIVLLIGIVKKNAIMMIDFALETERRGGKSTEDAIFEACMLRFRPILMTTSAALLGALPLALGTGMGYELRRPLGITIVGGLIVSQLLTLYTTPVVYLSFDRLRLRMQRRRAARRRARS